MCYAFLFAYIVGIVYLYRKLKDIKNNPKKYDVIPGFERYKQSKWYWPPKKDYGYADPPSHCGFAINGPFLLAFFFLESSILLAIVFSRPFLPRNASTIRFVCSPGIEFATGAFLALYSVCLSIYLPMFSKDPIKICYNSSHIFRKDDRSTAWEKMTKIVLVATILICPFHVLALKNSGYADSEKIIYSPYLSLCDKTIEYQKIERITIVYDEEGQEKKCYVAGPCGEQIDIHRSVFVNGDIELEEFVLSRLPSGILQEKTIIVRGTRDG